MSWRKAAVFAACFAGAAVAAQPQVIERRNFDHVMERADVDLGVATYPYDTAGRPWSDHDQEDLDMIVHNGHSEAGMACVALVRTPRYTNPAEACIAALDEALAARDRYRATIYASIACRRDRELGTCRDGPPTWTALDQEEWESGELRKRSAATPHPPATPRR